MTSEEQVIMKNRVIDAAEAARRLANEFARATGDSDEAHDEAEELISIIRADERAKVMSASVEKLKDALEVKAGGIYDDAS